MATTVQNQADELRVLHWNIHAWRDDAGASNLEHVVDLIRATSPHVVSLVEVNESWGAPSVIGELANRSGYASTFVPTFEFGQDVPVGGFGNALLTKLPVLAVQQRHLVWPPKLYDGSEPSEPRSVVFVKLRISAKELWVGSTHLPRSDADVRTDALHRLFTIAQDLAEPWVLCGDFNTPASSWLDNYPLLNAYPETAEPTYPTNEPVEPIDYCIVSPGVSIQAKVMTAGGSDHLPVLVHCQLRMSHLV